jgi:cytoskeleton protein RodZ
MFMDIGQTLRDARQRHELTLQEISRATKISVHILDAIERNEMDALARGLFLRGYLRAYANQVGLDPAHIVSEFRVGHEASEVDELRELRAHYANRSSGRGRWSHVVIVIAGLALLVYSLYISRPDRAAGSDPAVDTVPVIDERVPSPLPVAPARLAPVVSWQMS